MNRVIVLHAPLPGHASAEWEQRLLQSLPYARRLELESRDAGARRASLAATILLLRAAAELGFREVGVGDLRYPDGSKPSVEGGPHFSISHTALRVACAASREFELGLDHEEFEGNELPARLRHWTAVEATLKAAGAGLRRLAAVEIDADVRHTRMDGARYRILPLDFGPGVVASLAINKVPDAVETRLIEDVAA